MDRTHIGFAMAGGMIEFREGTGLAAEWEKTVSPVRVKARWSKPQRRGENE